MCLFNFSQHLKNWFISEKKENKYTAVEANIILVSILVNYPSQVMERKEGGRMTLRKEAGISSNHVTYIW